LYLLSYRSEMFKLTAGHDNVSTSLCQAQSLCMADTASTTNHYSGLACQIK
jgi:hypothetical protein